MIFERGPEGKIHVPEYRDGCYYGRLTDCCFLCLARLTLNATLVPIRSRIRDRQENEDHDLRGERIIVPDVDRSSPAPELDYREGTIDEVGVYPDGSPGLLTVQTDEGEYVHIGFPREKRGVDTNS